MTEVAPTASPHSLVPLTIRRWLSEHPNVRSMTVDGTVMSADISGFTRLAEHLSDRGGRQAAEALIRTINQCFDPMIDRVAALGGDVLKLGGDALFVLFPGPDSARRAAVCASQIQSDLHELNADLTTALTMSVGLATGPVPLVLAGSTRRDLVVRGETVDECLRLESEAEPGEVLVCRRIFDALPSDWVVAIEDGLHALDLNAVAADHDVVDEAAFPVHADLFDQDALDVAIGPELTAAFDAFVDTIGEIRLVTVAFVELATRGLDDSTLGDVVDRLLDLCGQHGVVMLGSDVAVGGVKFMMSAGAPTSGEDDEDAMLRVLSGLVFDPEAPAMAAGVNRGLVYAGFLGSDRNRTFTTMGDPTNLAARLLGRAEPRSVVVAQSVLDHCIARWASTELAPILVRGRREPVVIHRLDGPTHAEFGHRMARPRPPLVGRESELMVAAAVLATARRGEGQVLDFRGRRGVGLSRLLDEIDQRRPDGFVRFRIDGRTSPSTTAYIDIGPILASIIGVDDNPDPDFRLQELTAWIDRTSPDSIHLLPLLAPMLGLETPATAESAAIEPEFRLSVSADVVAAMLGRTLTTPTLFLIDDLHRIDAASLSVLRALAVRAADRPWALITAARADSESLIPGTEPDLVPPLTDDETIELVACVAPDLADSRRSDIARRSAGNPFFAVELAQADPTAESAPGSESLLDSIERLVTAQIDRLGHNARVVLRTASVLGPTFDATTLGQLLDIDRSDLGLDELSGLLDKLDADHYRFRAAVVWEVAYGGLSSRRKDELHAAIAELLEHGKATAADLAMHHYRAGNHRAAIDYARQAADEAAELGLMVDATDQLLLTVDAIDQVGWSSEEAKPVLAQVLKRLYEVGVSAGRHADAVAAGERALDLIDDKLTRIQLLTGVASTRAEAQGSYEAEIELLSSELDDIGSNANFAAARAWLGETLAVLKYRRGDVDEALLFAERARDEAKLSNQLRPLTSALLIRHIILGDRGSPELHQAWEDLIVAAEELGDPKLLTFAHNNMGLDLQDAGDWAGAVGHYQAAADHAGRSGDRYRRLFPAINRAVLRCEQGHRDEARLELDRLRRDAAQDASGFTTAWANRELGRLEAFAGRRDEAIARLDAARQWYQEAGKFTSIHEVDLTAVAADLSVGRSQAVLEALAVLESPDEPSPRVTGWADTLTGFALLQQDHADEAFDAFERAASVTIGRYRFGYALALFGRSVAERFDGRTRSARRTRAEADAVLEELGVVELPYIPLPR